MQNSRMIQGKFSIGRMTITPTSRGNLVEGDEQVTLGEGASVQGVAADGTLASTAALSMSTQAATKPAIPQGASEIGIMIATWNGKVDEHGNLLGKNGEIITEADKGETLKDSYPSAQALLDDATRINYTGTVKIDGYVHHRGGDAVVGYEVRADGTAHRMAQSPAPVRPAPVVTVPMQANDADTLIEVVWPTKTGQVKPRTNGMGSGKAIFVSRVPLDVVLKPTQTGQIAVAECPGSAVIAHYLRTYVNDKLVGMDESGNTAPTLLYTIGNPDGYMAAGANFNMQPGDVLRGEVTNGANETSQPSDILYDFSTPERY